MRTKVNLTLDKDLSTEARALNLNMSRLAEEAIAKAIKAERERLWKEEHAETFRLHNERIEKDGIPLAEFRKF